jgi:hypothetical protein
MQSSRALLARFRCFDSFFYGRCDSPRSDMEWPVNGEQLFSSSSSSSSSFFSF